MPAERRVLVPDGRWQEWKKRWAPRWWLRFWPVRTRSVMRADLACVNAMLRRMYPAERLEELAGRPRHGVEED